MKRLIRAFSILAILLLITSLLSAQCTFQNHLGEGADPHASFYEGKYYLLVTRADRITIKSAEKLQDIAPLREITVWNFENTPVGGHIWAPELHYLDGDWYIYSCGQNTGLDFNTEVAPYVQERQEMFVLKSTTGSVFGPYEFLSWLMPGLGGIDETIFTHSDGRQYIIWSQFNIPDQPQNQCLYIAELLSPASIGVKRVMISCPDQSWERHGWPVNEGAAVLQRNGKTYVVYSGSGYLTPEYALGYLVNTDGDLLNPASWTKVGPVFQQNPAGGIYSTGHNSFTTSPDGSEDWIVYHARLSPDGNTPRYTFMQKFDWIEDAPYFGKPLPLDEHIDCPSDTGWVLPVKETGHESILVYPVPARDFLSIKLPEHMSGAHVQVINPQGQTVVSVYIQQHGLNISNLPEGMYFLNISAGDLRYLGRFIKERS